MVATSASERIARILPASKAGSDRDERPGGSSREHRRRALTILNTTSLLLTCILFSLILTLLNAAVMNDLRNLPAWLEVLSEEDLQFVRRFVLSSGSLKALADEYGVSYPTVRARLDRLIAKVQAATDPKIADPFQRKLRVLVADGQIASVTARELLDAYRAATRGGKS
ncbi:MAG: DUF2089 family protein [Burkholderiales bacterium]